MFSESSYGNEVDRERLDLAWKFLIARDYANAVKEYSTLAEKGYSQAWLNLGLLHKKGLGFSKSFSEAERCFNKALALGDAGAHYRLGRLYKDDGAVEKSFDSFLKAANADYLPGIYWVGRAYLRGSGVEKDLGKAQLYLKNAAGRGHVYAGIDYSAARIKGVFGVSQIVAGILGLIKATASAFRIFRNDPYGDRAR